MIDSGASTSFIDVSWAKRYIARLLVPKSTPFQVTLGDGELTKTCRVNEEVRAQITIGEHEELNLCLSVTKLSYPIMLGISWLKQHDPWIHWSQHCIPFNSPHCLSSGHIHEPTTVIALAQRPQDTLSEVELELEPKTPVVAVAHNQQDIPLSVVEPKPRSMSKPPFVAVVHNQQDTALSVVKPKRPLSKTPVVALEFNQQDTALSVVKPKPHPLPSTKPKETPSVESDITVPLALADLPTPLPHTLGEDQRDENDGQLRVLPPRDPVKVIRRKVLRKSHKKDTVDQAKPRETTKSTSVMSTPAVSMINSIAFEHLIKQRDVQVFQVSIAELSPESLQSE
jgi:hypothetical protein